jgi:hypothetical protein
MRRPARVAGVQPRDGAVSLAEYAGGAASSAARGAAKSRSRTLGAARAAVAAAAVAYVITLLLVASPATAVSGVAAHVAFACPGVFIVRAIAGRAAGWLLPLTLGPLVGTALSGLALLALWAMGGRGVATLAASPFIAALLVHPARHLAGRFRLSRVEESRRDAAGTPDAATADGSADTLCLSLLLLIVPVVVARAFSLVGAELPDGQVYRAYFTADYVWRRAVVAELAKGAFPPANPFYASDALHYYWLPHLLDGLAYRLAASKASLDQLLLVTSVLVDAMFIAMLYGIARLFATSRAAAAGTACVVLFSSFEGAYAIWSYRQADNLVEVLRMFNIDAVSRWELKGMPIDGLHRLLLYQPHHALGYAMGYLAVTVLTRRTRAYDPAVLAAAGSLLGLSILISSFSGLMFAVVAAAYEGAAALRSRDWRRVAHHAAAAAVPIVVAVVLVRLLQYVDREGQILSIGLNPVAVRNFFAATAVSFGPVLLLGAAGAVVAWRRKRGDLTAFAALLLVCAVFYFFVDVKDHQNVYVGWRVGHLLFMGATVIVSVAFDAIGRLHGARRAAAIGATAAVCLLSSPTLAIDLYNTQDVNNRSMGPGFRWTLVLTPDEQEALAWIRRITPPEATVQVDAIPRGADHWAYVPAFAERRMAAGLPISMVPLAKYQQGSTVIHDMFSMPDAESIHVLATRFGIDYIVSGPPERRANPGMQEHLDSRPDLFPLLFRNTTISIYGVAPADDAATHGA